MTSLVFLAPGVILSWPILWAAGVFLVGVLAAGLASAWEASDEHGLVQAANRVLRWLGVEVYQPPLGPEGSFGVQATLSPQPLSEVTVVYPEIDPGSEDAAHFDYGYDPNGRVTRMTFTYQSGGQMLSTTNEYDAHGRTTRQLVTSAPSQ